MKSYADMTPPIVPVPARPELRVVGGTGTPSPDALGREIAADPMAFLLAHNLLTRASVAAGDRVLIRLSASGTAVAALRLAIARGASVAALCPPRLSPIAEAVGAEVLLGPTLPGAFDAVIDAQAEMALPSALAALRPGGRYALRGTVAQPEAPGYVRSLFLCDLPLKAFWLPREVCAGTVSVLTRTRVQGLASLAKRSERRT